MEPFHVLLIEHSNHDSCYPLLSQYGTDFSVTIANNENEALIALLYTRFNVILLDAALAKEDVISFVSQSGGLNCKTAVVIMLTANEQYLNICYETLNVVDYWLKPINPDLLAVLIRQQKSIPNLTATHYIKVLLDKTQNNKSLTLTIFKKLFTELPEQIIDINSALQHKHYQTALEITHKLHGSVGFCGFTDLQQLAYALENCLLRRDYQHVSNHFNVLKMAILNFGAQKIAILNLLTQH